MNDCIVPHVSSPNQLPLFDPIQITLTRGQVALVDPIDSDLAQFKWNAGRAFVKGKYYGFYAVRAMPIGVKPRSQSLHRVVMERVIGRPLTSNEFVDHINGNSLDDTRANLRIATRSQNAFNSRRPITNKSGYKGVYWHKDNKIWAAKIKVNQKLIHLGYFHDPEEAHAAYLAAAQKYAGEFARGE